jgi:hypothetical protein
MYFSPYGPKHVAFIADIIKSFFIFDGNVSIINMSQNNGMHSI